MRDKLQPTLYGVGVIGYINTREHFKHYKLWLNMISRCYNKEDKSYKYYGEKGVIVSERWHRFDYFFEDITKIEGYNEEEFLQGNLRLDKDIKSEDIKIYSLETCKFVSDPENQKQRTNEYNAKHKK